MIVQHICLLFVVWLRNMDRRIEEGKFVRWVWVDEIFHLVSVRWDHQNDYRTSKSAFVEVRGGRLANIWR